MALAFGNGYDFEMTRGKIDDLKKVVEHLERTGRTQMVRGINLDYHDGAVVSFKNS